MSIPGADEDLAEIHAAFAVEVVYTGAGLAGATIAAVPCDAAAAGFMGSTGSIRTKAFHILQSDMTEDPARGDKLVTADEAVWRVIEAHRRDDVAGWVVIIEAAE